MATYKNGERTDVRRQGYCSTCGQSITRQTARCLNCHHQPDSGLVFPMGKAFKKGPAEQEEGVDPDQSGQ